MSPDSAESRIGRLEREAAAMQQRVSDMADDLREHRGQITYVAEVRFQMRDVHAKLAHLETMIERQRVEQEQYRKNREAQEERERKDRTSWARQRGLVVMAAVCSLFTAILTTGAVLLFGS